jgi:hypothetical protein
MPARRGHRTAARSGSETRVELPPPFRLDAASTLGPEKTSGTCLVRRIYQAVCAALRSHSFSRAAGHRRRTALFAGLVVVGRRRRQATDRTGLRDTISLLAAAGAAATADDGLWESFMLPGDEASELAGSRAIRAASRRHL